MFGTCPLATGSRVGSATDPAGRGACTVTTDVPLLPSLVAVIVVVPPLARSVTSPLGETVATVGVLDVHATVRPVSVVPLASLRVTVSCTVPPTERVAGAGLTTTVATGISATVTVALPVRPSLMAVIVAVPTVPPVTSPLGDTDATVSALPAESFGVAVSCTVCPGVRLAVAGETCTEATGTIATLIVAVAVLLSLVAVIVAEPWVTPATCPVLLTVATLGLLLAHVTGRPVSVLPAASLGVAVRESV